MTFAKGKTMNQFTHLTLAAGTRSPAEKVASLEGWLAGCKFRLAELRASGAASRVVLRAEGDVVAYERMLERAREKL